MPQIVLNSLDDTRNVTIESFREKFPKRSLSRMRTYIYE